MMKQRKHPKLPNGYGSIKRLSGSCRKMYDALDQLGLKRHTPHDCRHTFSSLGAHFKVDLIDLKRMMGHALPDLTNKIYIHRSAEYLREELEKIKAPRKMLHLSVGRHFRYRSVRL